MINTVVKLKKDCLGNKAGTIGICYEEYDIGFGPGESYIFENGSYDGFNVEERASILEIVGAAAILRDPVENVMKLSELYRNGRFDEVFKTFKSDVSVGDNLYEFTMTNKNGIVTKSTIPCDDWLLANKVKAELIKSKNLIKVDFNKI